MQKCDKVSACSQLAPSPLTFAVSHSRSSLAGCSGVMVALVTLCVFLFLVPKVFQERALTVTFV